MKKELIKRWDDHLDFTINLSLRKENWQDKNIINARWLVQPFGFTKEGKLDFRVFPFREPIKYHHLRGIDFSHSFSLNEMTKGYGVSRGGSLVSSLVELCSYIEAKMPANLSDKFIECIFDKAIFDLTRLNGTF